MKDPLETPASATQETHGDGHIVHHQLQVGEVLPARLLPADLMRIFGIGSSRFYALLKAGRFDRFELRPTIGRRAWSGKLVMAYLQGEGGSSRFSLAKTGTR